MRIDGDGVPGREKRDTRRAMDWKTAVRPLWLAICLVGSAAGIGWAQVEIQEPKADRFAVSAFPSLGGGAMGFNGEPMVGVRISVGGEFWTGAQWRAAKVLSEGERPPPNEFLSAVVAKNPNGHQWGWSWSLTKDLPEGSNLPDAMYGVTVIIRQAPTVLRDGRGIRIDRQGPKLVLVSPPQTEKPGLGYHHDVEDPYLIGPKGIFPAVSGTASDPSGPIRVEVFLQRQNHRWWWQGDRWFRRRSSVCKVVIPYGAWRCDPIPPPDSLRSGGYQVTVEAVDDLGNRTQTPALRNVVVPLRQIEAAKRPQSSDRQPEWRKR